MIPLRDSVRARRFPLVTLSLVVLNVVAFLIEVRTLSPGGSGLDAWAVVPARLAAAWATHAALGREALTVLSSMFMHGDLGHLLGNMWFLWVFGDNVEDRLGRPGFVAFYVACGVAATVGQVASDVASTLPMIGASGAVAGVLGAYLRMYPRAKVLTLVPIFVFLQLTELPAVLFLGAWFALQLLLSFFGEGNVAWWAHVAGFVAGVVLALPFPGGKRPAPNRRDPRRAGRGGSR